VYMLGYEMGDREIAVDTRLGQGFSLYVPALLGPTQLTVQ